MFESLRDVVEEVVQNGQMDIHFVVKPGFPLVAIRTEPDNEGLDEQYVVFQSDEGLSDESAQLFTEVLQAVDVRVSDGD